MSYRSAGTVPGSGLAGLRLPCLPGRIRRRQCRAVQYSLLEGQGSRVKEGGQYVSFLYCVLHTDHAPLRS